MNRVHPIARCLLALLGWGLLTGIASGAGEKPVTSEQLAEFVRQVRTSAPQEVLYGGFGDVFIPGRKLDKQYDSLFRPYLRSEAQGIARYIFVDTKGRSETFRIALVVDRLRGTVVEFEAWSRRFFR